MPDTAWNQEEFAIEPDVFFAPSFGIQGLLGAPSRPEIQPESQPESVELVVRKTFPETWIFNTLSDIGYINFFSKYYFRISA